MSTEPPKRSSRCVSRTVYGQSLIVQFVTVEVDESDFDLTDYEDDVNIVVRKKKRSAPGA